jgi:hypothetical protein
MSHRKHNTIIDICIIYFCYLYYIGVLKLRKCLYHTIKLFVNLMRKFSSRLKNLDSLLGIVINTAIF